MQRDCADLFRKCDYIIGGSEKKKRKRKKIERATAAGVIFLVQGPSPMFWLVRSLQIKLIFGGCAVVIELSIRGLVMHVHISLLLSGFLQDCISQTRNEASQAVTACGEHCDHPRLGEIIHHAGKAILLSLQPITKQEARLSQNEGKNRFSLAR